MIGDSDWVMTSNYDLVWVVCDMLCQYYLLMIHWSLEAATRLHNRILTLLLSSLQIQSMALEMAAPVTPRI